MDSHGAYDASEDLASKLHTTTVVRQAATSAALPENVRTTTNLTAHCSPPCARQFTLSCDMLAVVRWWSY